MAEGAQFVFRAVEASDLPVLYALERDAYPADEAASEERMEMRARVATSLFRVLVDLSSPYVYPTAVRRGGTEGRGRGSGGEGEAGGEDGGRGRGPLEGFGT